MKSLIQNSKSVCTQTLIVLLMLPSLAWATIYYQIDFSSYHNDRLQNLNSQFPEGEVVLGGIPFSIPVGGINNWRSQSAGSGTNIIDIAVDVLQVTEVYTLINTDYTGSTTLEFFGSDGAYFQKVLITDDDIRDWNLCFSTQINGVTTVNVVYVEEGSDPGPDVMDMQIVALPPDFHDEVLETIRVTDPHDGGQAILSGLTVTPEPATIALLALGFVFLNIKRSRL